MKNIDLYKKIWSKRKQIVFALFAFFCYFIDSKISSNIIKAAAPAVVAGAAKTAEAAKAAKTAKTAADTAKAAKAASNTANAAKNVGNASNALNQRNANVLNRSVPKNTNPSTNMSANKNFTTSNASSDPAKSVSSTKKGFLKSFTPSEISEEEEEEETFISDKASSTALKVLPAIGIFGVLFGFIFLAFLVPLLALGVINASNSTLSQIDCSKQQGDVCNTEDSSNNFFSKIKNLFKYGTYGSNSEIIIKEFNDSYDKIKEEYDFEISLPLLSSTLFSDSEYIKTNVEDGKIVITDEMLDRSTHIYDTALLQIIPEYNVFTCDYENGEYISRYLYSTSPTYELDDTTTTDIDSIPTGECNYSNRGNTYKTITYGFDYDLYFKRLENSEELDLIYKDFTNSDKLLVSLIKNQYNIYKEIYNVDAELEYLNIPVQLYTDVKVQLSSPLKGWIQITSPFGNREGEYSGMHTGIDAVSSDKNIYSAGNGIVTRSNVETEGGNVIEITHTDSSGREYVTQYAHLKERLVNVGDTVNVGDVIGIMGDTGTMASGVHLHFAIWDKETKQYYNPRKLFSSASNY